MNSQTRVTDAARNLQTVSIYEVPKDRTTTFVWGDEGECALRVHWTEDGKVGKAVWLEGPRAGRGIMWNRAVTDTQREARIIELIG